VVSLVRLMGRTGVCLDELTDATISNLLDSAVDLLKSREFIEVLLPWIT
jgi:hypothetical protein